MTTPDGQQLDLRFDQSAFGEDDVAMQADDDRSSHRIVDMATFRRSLQLTQGTRDDDKSIIQRALASVRLFS